MKHSLKNIRPSTTPRRSVTIALALSISVIAALAAIVGNLASTAVPDALKHYIPYSWPALGIILLLGIIVTFWQVWYANGQSANNGALPTSLSQSVAPGASSPSISTPAAQPAPQMVVTSSPLQPVAQTASTSSQPTPQASYSGTTPATVVSSAPAAGSSLYHTCVISYSTDDEPFVTKLYTDLKAQGVPCWLADQDGKLGDKLRAEIYQAIRQLDKLLLVLSKNAIESQWVEEEVDVALDREHQQPGTFLLFPLRLDNEVLTSDKYWAITVRQRRIGDFRQWQQDAAYQQALQRLLRDLHV